MKLCTTSFGESWFIIGSLCDGIRMDPSTSGRCQWFSLGLHNPYSRAHRDVSVHTRYNCIFIITIITSIILYYPFRKFQLTTQILLQPFYKPHHTKLITTLVYDFIEFSNKTAALKNRLVEKQIGLQWYYRLKLKL